MNKINVPQHSWEFDFYAYRLWYDGTNWFWLISIEALNANPTLNRVYIDAYTRLSSSGVPSIEFCIDFGSSEENIKETIYDIYRQVASGGIAVTSIEGSMDPNFSEGIYYVVPFN